MMVIMFKYVRIYRTANGKTRILFLTFFLQRFVEQSQLIPMPKLPLLKVQHESKIRVSIELIIYFQDSNFYKCIHVASLFRLFPSFSHLALHCLPKTSPAYLSSE